LALQQKSLFPEALLNLGNALSETGQIDEAIGAYRKAIQLRHDQVEAHNSLGAALTRIRRYDDAVKCYETVMRLQPNHADAYTNLSLALKHMGKDDQAIEAARTAVQLNDRSTEAHNNLGFALYDVGRLDEALAELRRAIEVDPTSKNAHSSYLYCLHFDPRQAPESILAAHRQWAQTIAERFVAQIREHTNNRSPDRKIKIAYISPDFREHPVGVFMMPILQHHNRDQFEVTCYSDTINHDNRTALLRAHADQWFDTAGHTDDQLTALIREHQIDILVDLALHTGGNRMLVFARKPAPVQITYLAYPGTSGLKTIDYRITDHFLDPEPRPYYTEQSLHLPRCYWCYELNPHAPAVSPLPAKSAGAVTFGSLNNLCKNSTAALDTWAKILQRLPNSKLLMHAPPGGSRQRILDHFNKYDLAPDRIEFTARVPYDEYLATYKRIDIALDAIPYNGGTTTCDALYMGVPVVSLAGKLAVHRAGASLLGNLGLSEMVADSPDRYIDIAVALANDLPKLTALRNTLRQRMLSSPIAQAAAIASDLEELYRKAWRTWCTSLPTN
jgi:predicted O-linked N-acetylglucosamine transferase (SPINDLY family)